MITSKHINKIIAVLVSSAVIFVSLLTIFPNRFCTSNNISASQLTYPQELFYKDQIMTVDISVDQDTWNNMLKNAKDKEYICCDVTVNGTTFKSVGVRTKGNSSLNQLDKTDSTRYSLKFEFDHYVKGQTCFGLDKFVVNNIQADTTYMKEYLSYAMLDYIGVESSQLCAFSDISVNGEKWGFYLAVEGVEESFAERVYGNDYGKLYKPETVKAGGKDMDKIPDFKEEGAEFNPDANNDMESNPNEEDNLDQKMPSFEFEDEKDFPPSSPDDMPPGNDGNAPDFSERIVSPDDTRPNEFEDSNSQSPETNPSMPSNIDGFQDKKFNQNKNQDFPKDDHMGPGFNDDMGNGGADLIYSDDNIDSYSDIFDNPVFDVDDTDKQRVIKAIKNLNSGTDLEKYVDVDQTLRYFAANTVMVNLDSYICNMKHNYYLYEKDGQISIVPWDYNLSYAGFQAESSSEAVNFSIDTPTASGTELSQRPLIGKLLEVDEYKQLYHDYIEQIVDGFLNPETFSVLVDKTDILISEYVKNDPSAAVSFEEYKNGINTLKRFAAFRTQSIIGQLNGSIPSTRDGQKSDPSNLVDASSIDVSSMGSQGGSKGKSAPPDRPTNARRTDNNTPKIREN